MDTNIQAVKILEEKAKGFSEFSNVEEAMIAAAQRIGEEKREAEKELDPVADNDATITAEKNPLPERKPYPKNGEMMRTKHRGIGFTRKDKSKNKKSRRKIAKASRRKNRK